MSLYILSRRPSVGPLRLDAIIREEHEFRARMTDHPIEAIGGGDKLVDHIRLEPPELHIEGVVSRTPLDPILIAENFAGRWSTAFSVLQGLVSAREPFSVVTSLGEYRNMFPELLRFPKGAPMTGAIIFMMHLRRVPRLGIAGKLDLEGPDADALSSPFDLGDQFGAVQP